MKSTLNKYLRSFPNLGNDLKKLFKEDTLYGTFDITDLVASVVNDNTISTRMAHQILGTFAELKRTSMYHQKRVVRAYKILKWK